MMMMMMMMENKASIENGRKLKLSGQTHNLLQMPFECRCIYIRKKYNSIFALDGRGRTLCLEKHKIDTSVYTQLPTGECGRQKLNLVGKSKRSFCQRRRQRRRRRLMTRRGWRMEHQLRQQEHGAPTKKVCAFGKRKRPGQAQNQRLHQFTLHFCCCF